LGIPLFSEKENQTNRKGRGIYRALALISPRHKNNKFK